MAERALGRLRRFGYAFGDVGINFGGIPTSMLFLFYLTEIVGLRAGLAGLAIALPKIWDALVDPMLGGWIDLLAERIGKRAPIALISAGAYVGALFMMFSLPPMTDPWMTVGAATLLLMVSSTAQTAFNVSQLALSTEMTSDPTDLTRLLSLAALVSTIFGVAGSALTPMFVTWSGGGSLGYSRMAAEVGVIAGLALLAFVFTTRNVPVIRRHDAAQKASLISSIKATTGNRSFYHLMAYLICFCTGGAILGAFLPFANQYVLHGDQQSLAALGGVAAISTIAGLPLAPVLVRKLGSRRAMQLGNLAVGISFGLLFAASFGPPWMSWAAAAGIGLGSGALGVLLRTTLLGVAQLKLSSGVLVPMGFYLGILVAGTKLGASAGSFAAGALLDATGFVAGGAQQSEQTITWLRLGYTIAPMGFFLFGDLFLRRVKTPDPSPAVAEIETAEVAST